MKKKIQKVKPSSLCPQDPANVKYDKSNNISLGTCAHTVTGILSEKTAGNTLIKIIGKGSG